MAQGVGLAALLLLAPAVSPAQQDPPSPDSIEQVMRTAVDSGFTGVVLVARGDSIIWRSAYDSSGPVLTPGSAFWIASMTKSFTAAAVLKLCDQRRLSLEDSISSILPDVPPDKRSITIRQLLTHTAGFGTTYTGGELASRSEAVRAILAQPLARSPGSGYEYEDGSYELLAAIVEVVSGVAWEDYLQRELLTPAGLTQTGFWCRHPAPVPRPVPGIDGTSSHCDAAAAGTALDDWGHRGANGMSSTVDDLLRWAHALASPATLGFAGSFNPGAPQVWARREGRFDISSGYGTRVYMREGTVTEVWISGSGDDGHTGVVRMLSSGTTIIVLSNAGMRNGATWGALVAHRLAPRQ
jgi:CubicO group peptidase (beta-lactamase class C family)